MPTAAQDMNATDNLKEHITENEPRDNDQDVALGTTISVTFDRDIKTVSINKLFEVSGRGLLLPWCTLFRCSTVPRSQVFE